jgi:outer membrane protein insertion porin family
MTRLLRAAFLAALLALAVARSAQALEPFVIRDIRIEGIQRIEAGTIFSYLPVKVGETMTDEKAAAAIRALFGTGFFRDVRLDAQGNVLVVTVEERPAIASIEFSGMKEFDKDQVKKSLREVGFQEGRIFDRAMLEQAEQELKRQYLSRGKYGVQVTTTATPVDRNRVAVTFSIDEGEVAKITKINIVGNSAVPEKELLDQFVLRTPGLMTWYTKNDQYSRQKLQADLESLRSYYLNRGYLDFNIESTQVSITPDKRDIYITVNITEGEIYTVSDVKLGGEMLVPEAELMKLVTVKPGEPFSREKLTETTKKIADRLGNEGYAFANANAVPAIDKEKRTVAFTILIDPGRRVYVRRINIVGNNRTRDEVIRRELRQLEGSFYDAQKLQLSKQRIDKTGYFSEVELETPAVTGTSDQVDVTVRVKERATGNLLVGLGFSTVDRFIVQASVSQSNIFGTGNTFAFQANSGTVNKTISLSYTNPYYTVDGVSRGFDVYKRTVDARTLGIGNYKTSTLGGGVRYGVPFTEYDTLLFGLAGEDTKLQLDPVTSPARFLNFESQFGSQYTAVIGTSGWVRDKRDSAIWPTDGTIQRANYELATPAGDLEYWKATYQNQAFFPLTRDITLMLDGELGTAHGYDGKPIPFFKNFYLGGVGSVRGYRTASLGPRDVDGSSLGGTRKTNASAELLFPFPGTGKDRSMRLGTFVDGGQVYGQDEKVAFGTWRYSAGLSFAWNSPLGPMKFSMAWPIREQPGDRIQRFQFLLGTIF